MPFYEPKALRERNIYLDSDSDLEKSRDPYKDISFEKRAKIEKEAQFQKVIDKYRKVKDSEDKIRLRKEAALALRRQMALSRQAQGRDGETVDASFLEMAAKVKPTKVDKLPALYKQWLMQNVLPGYERYNKAEAAAQKKKARFGGQDQQERPNSGRSDMTRMTGGMTATFTQATGKESNNRS